MTSTTTFRTAWRAHGACWSLATALLAPAAWAAPLTVNGDGTVTDGATGLVWDRCAWGQTGADCSGGSATPSTWAQALAAAQMANTSSHKDQADWRLPNKNELESLVTLDGAAPYIDTTAFPDTPASVFWSSTTYAPDPAVAWVVDFSDGDTDADGRSYTHAVRLVRGGRSFAFYDALGDTTAPTVALGAPTPGANGTTASAGVQVNEAASGWWRVLPASSPAPTAADIQSSGTATGPLAANVAHPIALGNLLPGTDYVLYFVAQDSSANQNQSAVQSQPFRTLAAAAPTPVPALSPWALGALGLGLLSLGARRRRRV